MGSDAETLKVPAVPPSGMVNAPIASWVPPESITTKYSPPAVLETHEPSIRTAALALVELISAICVPEFPMLLQQFFHRHTNSARRWRTHSAVRTMAILPDG